LDCIIQPEAVCPEAWAKRLNDCGPDVYLLGDGAALYQEIWRRDLRDKAILLPPFAGLCRGGFVALAAMDMLEKSGATDSRETSGEQELQDFYGMKPVYLRGI
jgi:hypothetical protein